MIQCRKLAISHFICVIANGFCDHFSRIPIAFYKLRCEVCKQANHILRNKNLSITCDGQILVTQDMVGLFADFTPKFVKRYGDAGKMIAEAVGNYADEVRNGQFPTLDHCFGVKKTKD